MDRRRNIQHSTFNAQRSTLFARVFALAGLILCFLPARAQTTNALSPAEIEGRALAEKMLAQGPAEDSTNTGVLRISGGGRRIDLPIKIETIVAKGGWEGIYEVTTNTTQPNDFVQIIHHDGPNLYSTRRDPGAPNAEPTHDRIPLSVEPFAGSDFWLCDLGLEFLRWPRQKILKKEFHRQCPCMVLESTNPHPAAGGYSRVVCWVDENSLGIVEAYADDANGRELKNFYPKSLEKVNGQYQVQSMVINNRQTGSRSEFEFDLHP